jgi:hypothetical protein
MLVLDENLPAAQRLLLHSTQAKRMGAVVRVHADGLSYWRVAQSAQHQQGVRGRSCTGQQHKASPGCRAGQVAPCRSIQAEVEGEWNLHNCPLGRRIEEVGAAHVEGERDLLAHVEVIRGADAANEGMGVASRVEIGLRSKGLDDFHRCLRRTSVLTIDTSRAGRADIYMKIKGSVPETSNQD